jgi:hypothetical protein
MPSEPLSVIANAKSSFSESWLIADLISPLAPIVDPFRSSGSFGIFVSSYDIVCSLNRLRATALGDILWDIVFKDGFFHVCPSPGGRNFLFVLATNPSQFSAISIG